MSLCDFFKDLPRDIYRFVKKPKLNRQTSICPSKFRYKHLCHPSAGSLYGDTCSTSTNHRECY